MSTGARLPLEKALRVAEFLYDAWRLSPRECVVVGSVRRGRPDVGDLEILAPLEPRGDDTLCRVVQATMEPDSASLFAASGSRDRYLGRVERGLKPGFLAASLVVRPWGIEIPVQIYRYEPENLGWMLIERTGPADFGRWFLGQWKKAWGIPAGEHGRPASIDNHLVDAQGRRVPVPTEADAFRMIRSVEIPPRDRDAVARRAFGGRS